MSVNSRKDVFVCPKVSYNIIRGRQSIPESWDPKSPTHALYIYNWKLFQGVTAYWQHDTDALLQIGGAVANIWWVVLYSEILSHDFLIPKSAFI